MPAPADLSARVAFKVGLKKVGSGKKERNGKTNDN